MATHNVWKAVDTFNYSNLLTVSFGNRFKSLLCVLMESVKFGEGC